MMSPLGVSTLTILPAYSRSGSTNSKAFSVLSSWLYSGRWRMAASLTASWACDTCSLSAFCCMDSGRNVYGAMGRDRV
jgi:hypothetical protein